MKPRPNAAATFTFATALLVGCSSSSSNSGNNSSGGSSGSSGSGGGSGGSGSGSSSGSGGRRGGTGSTDEGGASDSGASDATTSRSDAAVGVCPAGVLGHCDVGATYPQYPGYTLALVEDFPAPVDLDGGPIFTWSDGSRRMDRLACERSRSRLRTGR